MTDPVITKPITLNDVRRMVASGISREIVNGQWVEADQERRMASKRHGKVAAKLNYFLVNYVVMNPIGAVYADQTTYVLAMRDDQIDLIRIPDISFVKSEHIEQEHPDDFHYVAPDLAVEIISPSERIGDVQSKVEDYLTHGTQQVWCVYPEKQRIVVHFPDDTTKAYKAGDMLPGGELLPDFSVAVAAIFA